MSINNTDRKIFFTDLDNTLLNREKVVTQGNREAITKLLEAGHCFVLSSGRSLRSVLNQVERLGLPSKGCYISAYNGAQVYDLHEKKVIRSRYLPYDIVDMVFRMAGEHGLHVHTYDDDYVLSLRETDALKTYTDINMIPYRILERIPEDLTMEPYKVIVIDYDEPSKKYLEALRVEIDAVLYDRVDLFYSSDDYLEVMEKGVSKGDALKALCDYLGIPCSHAVSAGDAQNDTSMILAAGTGCVMINGEEEVKACADYVTERDCDHDGVAEIINRFVLAQDDLL